jgi:asparagine synthase (glutamine-hydrolysing)
MCGIAGILSFAQKKVEIARIKMMIEALHHRGPDGEGLWLNNDAQIGLGHRRLAIIDLTEKACQPMHYADGRYTIVYNGEIYNYVELKNDLLKKGYSFQSNSDTEVLLAIFDNKKEKCLDELDGMFAFAIWDEKEKKLFCARDRFGEKPFFYYHDKNLFVFASEMKALWSAGIDKIISRKRVFEYLLYKTISNYHEPENTFYENIKQLPPAHFLYLSPASPKIEAKKYWDIDISRKSTMSFKNACEEFNRLFFDSLSKRMRSDVAIGTSLSGGLDSSTIVCSLHRMFPALKMSTFSAVFPGFERDESKYIYIVLNKTGFSGFEISPKVDEIISFFEKISYHQEEPFGSASIMIQYFVMNLAKKNGVKVLLDGQGADETLAGYYPTWESYLSRLILKNPFLFKKEYKAFLNNPQSGWNLTLLKLITRALFYYPQTKIGNIRRSFIASDNKFFNGIHPDLVHQFKGKSKNTNFRPPDLKKYLYHLTMKNGLYDLLRYADRNSMANSIEVRLPFLNHKLVEFLFTLPENYLIQNGWSKYILRESMNGILPYEIQWRKEKVGYEAPQANWLSTPAMIEKINESIQTLKKEKIINNPNPGFNWDYLMLAQLYENK